jgi:hypothetical protein
MFSWPRNASELEKAIAMASAPTTLVLFQPGSLNPKSGVCELSGNVRIENKNSLTKVQLLYGEKLFQK